MTKIISKTVPAEDAGIGQALRHGDWEEYVGQDKIKQNLRIIIDAAKKRGEATDHLLFCGQAGLGKTTLALLVAKEMAAKEKMGDMAAILTNLTAGDVLFIDEAHRINRAIEEVLYPAMESRKLHLMVGKGPSARSLNLDLPPFTLVAATTRENLLSHPLRSRFGATFRLEYYSLPDIEKILARSAEILRTDLSPEAVRILALAARATPRVANRLLKRARDYAEVQGAGEIDQNIASKALELLDIDEKGLEPQDRKLLTIIIHKFNGGPVGLGTLAAALPEEGGVIKDLREPYLMTLGFIQRTPGGRVVLPPAYEHLGLRRPGELI